MTIFGIVFWKMAEKPLSVDIIQECCVKRNLANEDLDYQCSQNVLLKLSTEMDSWATIGLWLGLSKPDIEAIRNDSKNEEERRIAMLNRWKEKEGSKATYFNLVTAFKESQRVDLLEVALDYLKEKKDEGVDSDSSIQEKDLKLLCGCGNCSLGYFLEHGCPNPGVQRQFPLLNVTKLHSQKLAARLLREADKVVEEFASLMVKVLKILEERQDITVDQMVIYISNLQKLSLLNEPTYSKVQDQLLTATTKGQVIMLLQSHVSWFNHSLLGSFLRRFNVAVELYDNYIDKFLNPLLQKSLFEIPRKSSDSFSGSGQFVLKLSVPDASENDLSFVNVSANVVLRIKDKLASVFGLSVDAFEFCSYNKGCFELVFGGPSSILKEMLINNKQLMFMLHSIATMIPGMKVQTVSYYEDSNCQLSLAVEIEPPLKPMVLPSDAKMTNIDRMFAAVVTELAKSIESYKIMISKVQSFVAELGAHRSVMPTTKFFPLFNFTDVTQLSFREFMLLMKNYWSFFNCSLLDMLVKRYGNENALDALKRFVTHLQELSLSEVPTILHHLPQVEGFFSECLLVTMSNEFFISDNRSLEDLLLVRNRIAAVLSVEHYGLILRKINKEKCLLEFLVAETNRDDLLRFLTPKELSLINEFILEVKFKDAIIISHSRSICFESDEDTRGDHELDRDSGLETASDIESCSNIAHTHKSTKTAESLTNVSALPVIPEQRTTSSGYSSMSDEHDTSHEINDLHKGVLLVCGLCLKEINNEKLLLEKCLFPDVHGQVDAVNAAWNFSTKKLVHIRPRSRHLPSGKERFELYNLTIHGSRESCLYAHSQIECDAWNHDLQKETLAHQKAKEREIWKVNFANRLTRAVLQEEELQLELTAFNYRDKFYYLLCSEESEHIDTLREKCDGQYRIELCEKQHGQCKCRVLGMSDSQLQYAVQASEAVYFVKFENDRKQDLCKGSILSCNFADVSGYFYVSMSEEEFFMIKSNCHHLGFGKYNVHLEFEVKHSYFNTLHEAVISLPDSMIKKITTNVSKPPEIFLDPTNNSVTVDFIVNNDTLSIDKGPQIQALEAILQSPSDCPVLVSGPFGSGKTRILARATCEFAIRGIIPGEKQRKILVCAHHSNTVETYMKYLKPTFSETREVEIVCIVRTVDPQQKGNSRGVFYKTLAGFRSDVFRGQHINSPVLIIVTTYMTSLRVSKILHKFRFTHILLDEAAQVREPEAIAALSLGDANTKVVITGDSKQVGPSVLVLGDKPNQYGLGTSLMERLEKQYKKLVSSYEIPLYLNYLRTNYRCTLEIVELLSRVIYKYPIHCAVQPVLQLKHPLARFPCVFYWSKYTEDWEKAKQRQLEDVLKQVQFYFSHWPPEWKNVKKRDVCVMSPFRTQLNLISSKLQELKGITLLPSYQIQGHEFQAVILSTLEPLESDGTSSNPTKSLVNPKIFNTVVSRCKSLVVAVGDPFVLLEAEEEFQESCWNNYLKLCLENDTIFFHETNKKRKQEMKSKLIETLFQKQPTLMRSKSDGYTITTNPFYFPIQPSKSEPY